MTQKERRIAPDIPGTPESGGLNILYRTEVLRDGAVRLSIADLVSIFSRGAVENAHENQARIGVHKGDRRLVTRISKRA